MITGFLGPVGQIIGIHADTVAPDQPRRERQEIPFGLGGGQHVRRVDLEQMANGRELVHKGDVQVALGVLDHLGSLGNFDGRCFVNAGCHDGAIHLGNDVQSTCILRRHHLADGLKPVLLVPGIDTLW